MVPNDSLSYNPKAGPITGQTDTTLYKANYSIHTTWWTQSMQQNLGR